MFHRSLIVAAALLAPAAYAQEGLVDFSRIPGLEAPPTVQINLGAGMLAFVTATARATDPVAAEALAGLQNVRVHVYAIGQEDARAARALQEYVTDTARRLERDGWEQTVAVDEGEGRVRVHAKVAANEVRGLTMMVSGVEGSGEAVFINLAGKIDPAKLGQVLAHFGVSGMLDGMMLPTAAHGPPPAASPAPAPAAPAAPAPAGQ